MVSVFDDSSPRSASTVETESARLHVHSKAMKRLMSRICLHRRGTQALLPWQDIGLKGTVAFSFHEDQTCRSHDFVTWMSLVPFARMRRLKLRLKKTGVGHASMEYCGNIVRTNALCEIIRLEA
jgi:hypothetical protein